ncbi:MAG: hypothetical protein ACKO2V_15365, partial [Snowella sp.]
IFSNKQIPTRIIMATVTDTDLKEIKDLIIDLKINQVRMEERLSGQINALDEKLSGQINTLDQKVSGIDKRLEIVESRVNGLTGWLIGVLFALVGGLLGILGKLTFFPKP